MKNLSQRGIATIFVPIFLVLAVVIGIYLVQNRTNIFPQASNEIAGPETSFSLESNKQSVKIGETFTVDVFVRSDFDAANTFSALISYPADKLEVVGIEPPSNPPNVSPSPTLKISQDEKPNFVSQVFDKFSTKAEAQAPAPMPVISGKTYCSGGKPVVELNWSKVQTSDNEYLFIKSPDGKSGVTVSTFFDRYQYPIKDTGFISPVNLNTAYTYYLESFGGQKSNSVTVTTPANCSTATPTPTPAPVCGAFCINGDKDCAGAKDGCTSCVNLKCQTPASPSLTPTPTPKPSGTPTPHPSQSAMPPAVCGRTCKADDYCATAKDGCTSCLLNDAGTSYVCMPPPPTNLNFFIKKWVEQIDDKQGKVTLVGAVPNPGFKTSSGQKGLMAKITFKAKANGEVNLDFIKDSTAIYRNSDNQNILTTTRGVKILIGGTASPTPDYPGKMYLKAGIDRIKPGCVLPVIIAFDTGGRYIDGADVILKFNPKILKINSISKGILPEYPPQGIDNTKGIVTISGVATPEGPGFKGSGILATINYQVLANSENGAKTEIVFDYDPNNPSSTKDSNMVERGTIKELLGSVGNASFIVDNKSGNCPIASPTPGGDVCRAIACDPGENCKYVNGFTSTCNPAEYAKLTCGNLICVGSPSPKPSAPSVNGKRADLFKDSKKPNFVNDQDISVFFSKCAEKGIELFGQPASVQPLCDIFEDGKITVQDWAVLIKFRNQPV